MASLNEIFVSCALYFHYDGEVDIDSILEGITEITEKQKKGEFFTDPSKKQRGVMGFTPEPPIAPPPAPIRG
ncbi:hypothetical protein D3C71_2124960 [compost metagenome]